MEQKVVNSHRINTISHKNIIKRILWEKENDVAVKDKMDRILYEASLADEVNMDTDLIDECVKTIGLLEGDEQHLPEEKIQAMKKNIDRKYKDWLKTISVCHRNPWRL